IQRAAQRCRRTLTAQALEKRQVDKIMDDLCHTDFPGNRVDKVLLDNEARTVAPAAYFIMYLQQRCECSGALELAFITAIEKESGSHAEGELGLLRRRPQ